MKAFWVTQIDLDEEQDIAGITAVIDAPYLPLLKELVPDFEIPVIRAERGGTELWIHLDTAAMLALYHATGGLDSDHRLHIPDCYFRLAVVINWLTEDD